MTLVGLHLQGSRHINVRVASLARPSPLEAWKVKRQYSVSAVLAGPPTREPQRFQTQTAQQAMMVTQGRWRQEDRQPRWHGILKNKLQITHNRACKYLFTSTMDRDSETEGWGAGRQMAASQQLRRQVWNTGV